MSTLEEMKREYAFHIIHIIPRDEYSQHHTLYFRQRNGFKKVPRLVGDSISMSNLKRHSVERWHHNTVTNDYEQSKTFVGRWEDTGHTSIAEVRKRLNYTPMNTTTVSMRPLDPVKETKFKSCSMCNNLGCGRCNENPFSIFNVVTRKLAGKEDAVGNLVVNIKHAIT